MVLFGGDLDGKLHCGKEAHPTLSGKQTNSSINHLQEKIK
jgi:hypothetical protein